MLIVHPITTNFADYAKFVKTVNILVAKFGGGKTTPSANAATPSQAKGNESGGADSGGTGHQNQVRPWDPNEDYNQMNIGDKRRTADGRIWEAIDLGQVHRDPAGEFGHFGWREV